MICPTKVQCQNELVLCTQMLFTLHFNLACAHLIVNPNNSDSSIGRKSITKATVGCMSLRISADCPVWSIDVIGKIISHAASDIVTMFVLGADSPVSSAAGGWMNKTKDQINSFGPGLIAWWESKLFSLFFSKLWALTKLLIMLWPPEYDISHTCLHGMNKGFACTLCTLPSSQPRQLHFSV